MSRQTAAPARSDSAASGKKAAADTQTKADNAWRPSYHQTTHEQKGNDAGDLVPFGQPR